MKRSITANDIELYLDYLAEAERTEATLKKYRRDLQAFSRWLGHRAISKEIALLWKKHLVEQHYAPTTINSMISSLNGYFRYKKWDECRVRFLRIQRVVFRDQSRDLQKGEYARLLSVARSQGRERLALLMETICSTGIRVSELKYITVDAARKGRAEVALKGKIRVILLPTRLQEKLLNYASSQAITVGEIFITKHGKSLSRHQIWAEMKAVCDRAEVRSTKVFPHNLRHLFATAFYGECHDIAKLADVLGHSSIETTRLYLVSPGNEHARQLERLGLVS